MRDILSEYSGLPLSDMSIEAKYDYKTLLYPKKTNKFD